jgi:hypothetical protein
MKRRMQAVAQAEAERWHGEVERCQGESHALRSQLAEARGFVQLLTAQGNSTRTEAGYEIAGELMEHLRAVEASWPPVDDTRDL